MEAALDQWEQSFTVKHKQWLMLLELLEVHGSEKSESAVGGNIDWFATCGWKGPGGIRGWDRHEQLEDCFPLLKDYGAVCLLSTLVSSSSLAQR